MVSNGDVKSFDDKHWLNSVALSVLKLESFHVQCFVMITIHSVQEMEDSLFQVQGLLYGNSLGPHGVHFVHLLNYKISVPIAEGKKRKCEEKTEILVKRKRL
jgi:hypothetical protein